MEIYSTHIKSVQHLKVSKNVKNQNFIKQSSIKVYDDSDVLSVGVPEAVRLEKATAIRRIAVPETSVSRHNGDPIQLHKLSDHHSTIALRVLRPPLCRDTLISQTSQRM